MSRHKVETVKTMAASLAPQEGQGQVIRRSTRKRTPSPAAVASAASAKSDKEIAMIHEKYLALGKGVAAKKHDARKRVVATAAAAAAVTVATATPAVATPPPNTGAATSRRIAVAPRSISSLGMKQNKSAKNGRRHLVGVGVGGGGGHCGQVISPATVATSVTLCQTKTKTQVTPATKTCPKGAEERARIGTRRPTPPVVMHSTPSSMPPISSLDIESGDDGGGDGHLFNLSVISMVSDTANTTTASGSDDGGGGTTTTSTMAETSDLFGFDTEPRVQHPPTRASAAAAIITSNSTSIATSSSPSSQSGLKNTSSVAGAVGSENGSWRPTVSKKRKAIMPKPTTTTATTTSLMSSPFSPFEFGLEMEEESHGTTTTTASAAMRSKRKTKNGPLNNSSRRAKTAEDTGRKRKRKTVAAITTTGATTAVPSKRKRKHKRERECESESESKAISKTTTKTKSSSSWLTKKAAAEMQRQTQILEDVANFELEMA